MKNLNQIIKNTAFEGVKKMESDKDLKTENKREAFGNRHLTEDKNVFQFNAW